MKDLLHQLEERLRNSPGVRAAFPPHVHPPYRATVVDIVEFFYDHDMIDSITPVIGFQVPEGHLFYLDSIVVAGNIFQSPLFWDWNNTQFKLFVNNVDDGHFKSGSSGIVRADQGTGILIEVSPLLYCCNDISHPIIGAVNNLDAGDDMITRVRSGHSPVFGLEYEAQGTKVVYRPGDRVELRYVALGPEATIPGGGAMAAVHLNRLVTATQNAVNNNVGPGGIGIPPGPDNNPATDDAGLYNVGAFTPIVLGATALLNDQDLATPVAAIPAMNAWVGGESIGLQVGVAATGVWLKNQVILFLNRRSSQAEIDNITWQVGASTNNLDWVQLQLDRVRYREIPGSSLYWIEFDFTQNSVAIAPYCPLRGFPLTHQTYLYLKVRAATVNAAGIGANLRVTEIAVGYRVIHRIAARMVGWTWVPEHDVISAGGARVG